MSADADYCPGTDDPVEYFLQDMEYHGKTERTRRAYGRVLREFRAFLADRASTDGGRAVAGGRDVDATSGDVDAASGVHSGRAARDGPRADAGDPLATATRRDCMAWIHAERDAVADSTVATYASYLHRFYAYMTQVGAFEANPMALVVEEMDETIATDPTRREVSLPEMRSFVAGVSHPLERAVVVTLLKTGVRVGELCNLDRRDLHLTDVRDGVGNEGFDGRDEEFDVRDDGYDAREDGPTVADGGAGHDAPRGELQAHPDSLYVDSAPARGEVVNGERRSASNKRRRSTVVPVDDELRTVLEQWLAVRPDPVSDADPLFVSTRDDWGRRLTTDMAAHVVRTHARRAGWYRDGAGARENVTPHYFRHFFTTHLRDRTGDRGVVKYLRGDVATDVVDTYTHNWGDRVREVYETNVYSVL